MREPVLLARRDSLQPGAQRLGTPGLLKRRPGTAVTRRRLLHGLRVKFSRPGLYLLDEPEAALSVISCLRLVDFLHELGRSGSQVICATHSPIIASTPGAGIVELGSAGLQRTEWHDLEIVEHWRRYLDNPQSYLRHFISAPREPGVHPWRKGVN